MGAAGTIAQTVAGGGCDVFECGPSGTEPCTNKTLGNYATVGGGGGNAADWVATVAGGFRNTASGWSSTVAGGYINTASGPSSVVAGGYGNTAAGDYSFAAGRRAKTGNPGVFVWADSLDLDFNPWSWGPAGYPNSFNVRATGGLNFATAVDASGNVTTGLYVSSGGSGWNSWSDRNAKENVSPVDTRALLDRLAGIPIQTWNYKTQAAAIRHIGPMAQDFRAAFGVGEDEKTINSVDADGVALATIQGLYQVVQEQEARIASQEAEITALKAQNAEIVTRLSQIEAGLNGPSTSGPPAAR